MRRKAFEQFQDDFIAKLKASIDTVKGQIEELNDALKMSSFGNDKYRFVISPKPEYRRYYDMITDEMLLKVIIWLPTSSERNTGSYR